MDSEILRPVLPHFRTKFDRSITRQKQIFLGFVVGAFLGCFLLPASWIFPFLVALFVTFCVLFGALEIHKIAICRQDTKERS